MNWIAKTKYILGKFWTTLFGDPDFILGVEKLHALLGKLKENSLFNYKESMIARSKAFKQDIAPAIIYIDSLQVRAPYSSVDSILNGGTIGGTQQNAGWVAECTEDIAAPDYLTDHAVDFTKTLFAGLDYVVQGRQFLFYVDPATIGFPTVKRTDEQGNLHVYYVVLGWRRRKYAQKDAVAGFMSPSLSPYADKVWDVYINGATYYNAKALLGAVTGAVICEQDGVVNHLWQEQDYWCMLVDDKVYSAKDGTSINFDHGDNVKAGDILFGSMKFYSGRDLPPYSEVPGVRLRTDVGGLIAPNSDTAAYQVNGVNILPLTEAASLVQKYKDRAYELSLDQRCPYTNIPATVNPFKFVMQDIRRGRGCFAILTTDSLQTINPALQVIREGVCASGIFNVFVKAEGDTAGVTVSDFTADAGNAAVSVDATITIQEASVEAEVFV